MEQILFLLLKKLYEISKTNEEIFDSENRELMGVAIMEGFVRNQRDHILPQDLGMATDDANQLVRSAIGEYIQNANAEAESMGLNTFHDRLAAFQNGQVTFKPGHDYEEFFGHTPPEFYDEDGNVIRTY